MFQIVSLDHVALTVRDQNISLEWYQRVLGMERRYEEANGAKDPVFVCAGNACLALFPAETSDLCLCRIIRSSRCVISRSVSIAPTLSWRRLSSVSSRSPSGLAIIPWPTG